MANSFGHNAFAPVFLSKVIAEFCGTAMYIPLTEHANAAHNFSAKTNGVGKGIGRLGRKHGVDIIFCIIFGIRVRQTVAQIVQNFFV